MLETVHHQGLRLGVEAFRTSVQSLYVEAREASLQNRRSKSEGKQRQPSLFSVFQP